MTGRRLCVAERSPGAMRRRRVGFRLCLSASALFWLTIGFGIIDLASGFASGPSGGTDNIAVLSAAYGVTAAIVLPAAFLAQPSLTVPASRRRRRRLVGAARRWSCR